MTQASARAAGQPEKPALCVAASERTRLPQEPRAASPLKTRAGAVSPHPVIGSCCPRGLPSAPPPHPDTPTRGGGASPACILPSPSPGIATGWLRPTALWLAVGCSAGERRGTLCQQSQPGAPRSSKWGSVCLPSRPSTRVGRAHPRCLARVVLPRRRWDGRRGVRRQV